ncbi:MAG: trypsin-like peptidase domain-containing protein [Romboutsia sp.]|nr:trypsin-like peptidase domain-containing protein [Romboutsia sp.]
MLTSCLLSFAISSLTTASVLYISNKNNSNNITQIITSNEKTENVNVYKAVADKASPSVVGITTQIVSHNDIFNITTENRGTGTGIIIDPKGYILTNSHVVNDGLTNKLSVLLSDGKTVDGEILWNDALMDLAVIKVESEGLVAAELGNSDDLSVGDIAIAIGNPIGLDFQKTVTQGIISGLDRNIEDINMSMNGLIQTDASINPGNSGGPLLNTKGQVIGITTAKISDSEGIGFAIPINVVKSIVEQIIDTGTFEKVKLGIKGVNLKSFEALTNIDLTPEYGIYILETELESVSNKAGLIAGDILISINDTDIKSMNQLNSELYKYSFGDEVKIKVNRNGEEKIISVKFDKDK